jgi:hypothetical protein
VKEKIVEAVARQLYGNETDCGDTSWDEVSNGTRNQYRATIRGLMEPFCSLLLAEAQEAVLSHFREAIKDGSEEVDVESICESMREHFRHIGLPETALRENSTMKGDPQFTLYWRTGQRQIVEGRTIAEAMALAGIGGGAAPALDFWAHGDNHRYEWDAEKREWYSLAVREAIELLKASGTHPS